MADETYGAIIALRDEMRQNHAEVLAKIAEVHAYIEKIETEANDMMAGMNSPDAMMKLAGKFLGTE
jgi:hypothetical protein